MATSVNWTGLAIKVPEVVTITFASTWASTDSATITLTNNTTGATTQFIVTLGTPVTTTDMATLFARAFNSIERINDALGSSNVGGQQIAEFTELEATSDGAVVTITTREGYHGWPFHKIGTTGGTDYWAVTEATIGSGTATLASVQQADGPNWFNNADNWTDGAIPADDDEWSAGDTDESILFGLPDHGSFKRQNNINIHNTFNGMIGLPIINRNGTPYYEYRARHYINNDTGAPTTATINIGIGDGDGPSYIAMLQLGSVNTTFNVDCTSNSAPEGERVVNIAASASAPGILNVRRGLVRCGGLGFRTGGTAITNALTAINLTAGEGEIESCDVEASWTSGSTVVANQLGGRLSVRSSDWTNAASLLTAIGGETILYNTFPDEVVIGDGSLAWYGPAGTIPLLTLYNAGKLDMSRATAALTLTNANFYAGCEVANAVKKITHTNPAATYGRTPVVLAGLDYGHNRTVQFG